MAQLLILVAKRLLLGAVTLLVISLLIFFAVELLPGDAADAILGQGRTEAAAEQIRERLGLNEPAIDRYLDWLSGAVQGDFGLSWLGRNEPVTQVIADPFANTMFLAGYAAAIAVPLALILGVTAALFRNTVFDRVANASTLTAISTPEFFVGYIIILIFTTQLDFALPTYSPFRIKNWSLQEWLFNALLPALTLVLVVTAHMMRMTRAAIINLLASPYIEMAKLKGAPRWKVIVRHALPNAWAPIINVVALNLAYLITGVVLVEAVFDYPGIGRTFVDAVKKQNLPIVQACCMIFASTFILLNLLADVFAILANPRLRRPK